MVSPVSRCLVIVATYNERDNLPSLVDAIFAAAPTVHLLVVDDNSPDGTGIWCDERAAADARVRCLHRATKQGLGAAVLAGLSWALEHGYDVAVNMDADFSHPPTALPALLAALEPAARHPADVAIGSRYVPGGRIENWSWRRHLLSRMVNWYSRWILRLPARDCSGGYRAYRLAFLRTLDPQSIESRGYAFFEEQLWRLHRAGARIVELPITFVNRSAGASKVNFREMCHSAGLLLRFGWQTWCGGGPPRRPPPDSAP